MAEPIRPGFQNPSLQQGGVRQDARSAAQRAFFQAAMGQPAATPASQPQVQPQAQPQRVAATPQTSAQPIGRIPTNLPADPPTRILRPGSLLDIKV